MWYNAKERSASTQRSFYQLASKDCEMDTPIIPQKQCSKCKKFYPQTTEYFNKASKASDGLRTECKECRKPSTHEYYVKNFDKMNNYAKEWSKNNPEKRSSIAAKSRHKNPEPTRNSVKRYRHKYPEKTAAREAIKYAVKSGKIPSAKACLCKYCGNKADAYHHWSYLPEHRLDVIPLCTKCHKKEHMK